VLRRAPGTVTENTKFGAVELVPDAGRARGWLLLIDGTPQSYVDLNDPQYLEFEYVRWLASIVDIRLAAVARTPAKPTVAGTAGGRDRSRVLHLGGGGLTLPRYIAATHPRVSQRVVERDGDLIDLVRRVLPLPAGLRVRVADAREVVRAGRAHWYDIVVTDAFSGGQVPAPLTTTEFAAEAARVLRPGGWYTLNLVDGPPLRFAKSEAATLREVFDEVCLVTEPGVLRRRRFGNLVLMGGSGLPLDALAKAVGHEVFPARVLHGDELDRFVAGARPFTDANVTDPPVPPRGLLRPMTST
jgi:hypothetical protein